MEYEHIMPKCGDQVNKILYYLYFIIFKGIKPDAERRIPDMTHDPNFKGVSPFSESGRWVYGGGSNIPMRRILAQLFFQLIA